MTPWHLVPARLAMPARSAILAALAILVGLAGCTKNPAERRLDASLEELGRLPEVPLASVSLSTVGMNAAIDVPAGAVPMSQFPIPRVNTPSRDFAIIIERAYGPMAERKQVIAENPYNRLVGYVITREHALLYRSRFQDYDEYHMLVLSQIDGVIYECRNDKEQRYTLAQANTMLRACLTLRAEPGRP